MNSKLFLRNITNIDHAFINYEGRVIGGSFHASAIVSGEVDPTEKVVIDFSKCKKDIKAIIDDHQDGFDHKLWVIDGVSDISEDNGFQIVTPACTIAGPNDMYKRFAASAYTADAIAVAMSAEVTKKMQALYPNVNVTVTIQLTTDAFTDTDSAVFFRYVHGLKNSSSVGCRRNSHGHLSFIECRGPTGDLINLPFSLQGSIVKVLNEAVFVWSENIVQSDDSSILKIYYTACDGREYTATYNREKNNVIVLDTETTVEYLAEFIKNVCGNDLRAVGVSEVFVSEGLQKGAVVTL